MSFGRGRGSRLAALTAGACLVIAVALAPAISADVTIGANVAQSTLNSGTCGFASPAERPCTFVTSTIPGQTMTAALCALMDSRLTSTTGRKLAPSPETSRA